MPLPTVHGPATIAESAVFGDHCLVWQYATVCEQVSLGEGSVVGSCAWIGSGVTTGTSCRIQHGAFLCRNAVIGHRVFIGPNASLADDAYPVVNHRGYQAAPPRIEDDVSIGAGAVICPGVTIGRGAMIGAGAVVTRSVPAWSTFAGVPARRLDCSPLEKE